MSAIREWETDFGAGCYPMREQILVKGRGALVWDAEGREYIDCVAGHGVANVGHAHPAVVESIRDQAGKLITCSATFYNEPRALLLQKLNALTPPALQRAFLCNSGTEAVEAALKMARYVSGKSGVISAMRSFHGRTLGALSATHN
ncbi:MAG TPA: aminotransferase class III-fold pyridoxal phosphate-dependent enzyme, partial [Caldithrix abyssi]|nr:aminotransferase class III-fold pyridoxal phosphate-dependent enzyme [Caldithrix abyssi]